MTAEEKKVEQDNAKQKRLQFARFVKEDHQAAVKHKSDAAAAAELRGGEQAQGRVKKDQKEHNFFVF